MGNSELLLVCAVMLLTACGGGGSGDGNNKISKNEVDATKSAQLVHFAYNSALNTIGTANAASVSARVANKAYSESLLVRSITEMSSSRSLSRVRFAPQTIPANNCTEGGSEQVSTTSDESGVTVATTYAECKWSYDADADGQVDTQVTQNGVTRNKTNSSGYELVQGDTDKPYTYKIVRLSDSRVVSENSINNVVRVTYGTETYDCGGRSRLKQMTISLSGTDHEKEDENKDGTVDVDSVNTATDFIVKTNVESFDETTCSPKKLSIAVTGKYASDDHVNTSKSVTMESKTDNALSLTIEQATKNGIDGQIITVNGTPTITTPCSTSTVSFNTSSPLFLGTTASCATEGTVRVSSARKALLQYTSTGGIDIDADDNGSIDTAYGSCIDAPAACN